MSLRFYPSLTHSQIRCNALLNWPNIAEVERPVVMVLALTNSTLQCGFGAEKRIENKSARTGRTAGVKRFCFFCC